MKKFKSKILPIIGISVIIVAFALLLIIPDKWLTPVPKIAQTPPATEEIPPIVEKNPHSIAIPGYEELTLKANSKQQSLALPNPAQNMCYFEIFLYLEDGTLLWKSSLIEPGKTSRPIILTQPLAKGTYAHAVLKYQCFKTDGSFAPLNGAETKVTLRVK